MNDSISEVKINKYSEGVITQSTDLLAVEEPLEIKILSGAANEKKEWDVSITMRTPGNDYELAVGFLFTEGIIKGKHDLDLNQAKHASSISNNRIIVHCKEHVSIDASLLQRNFYTTSACGVCGKASIDALYTLTPKHLSQKDFLISKELIIQLPDLLQQQQKNFIQTGGIHAAALFDTAGKLLYLQEDVGRHNALDKLIGHYLLDATEEKKQSDNTILLLSGRASFELIQKSAMAGFSMICAVGAPSSLAVETANRFGITLIGFLRGQRFNIYSHAQRVC